MAEHRGNSSLFGIFIFSIYTLALLPYTIHYLCSAKDDNQVQPFVEKKKKKSSKTAALLKRVFSKGNLVVIALWVVWGLLLWWTQANLEDMKPFDPFEILELERGATDKEIKKAYRTLSLKYHPDKNPDPAAAVYFAEYITKAYKALTDEASRENYEKYGHPDGPQAMDMGVALPEWLFPKDSKIAPFVLLGLVGCGVLLPLILVSWHMLSSNKLTGPNGIMQETLMFYLHSKYSVKESQGLTRIPETLVCALEFINMPTPAEQSPALDELRRMALRSQPDLKDKPQFWKRKASVLKAHMLLLEHLERNAEIPAALQQDLRFVLQKSPVLLEEMVKIAMLPRPPHGYGWLTPCVAIVEMMQCLVQPMSLSDRKGGKPADPSTVLLQLPHFDQDVIKKLKRRKVGSVKELLELPEAERIEALTSSGLTEQQADEALSLVLTLPTVHVKASIEVENEVEVMEQDVAKCKVRLLLTRPSHNLDSFEPPSKGRSVRALTPLYPLPRDENWYIFLCEPSSNSVLGYVRTSLAEAEEVGYHHSHLVEEFSHGAAAESKAKDSRPVSKALATASKFISRYPNGMAGSSGDLAGVGGAGGAGGDDGTEAGQLVEIAFQAPPKAGKFDLQVVCMCDSYVGCDRTKPLSLRVIPMTRAVLEGREARAAARQQQQWASESEGEDGGSNRGGSDAGDADSDEGSDGDDYDSDETGELETGDEASEAGDKAGASDDDEPPPLEGIPEPKKDK